MKKAVAVTAVVMLLFAFIRTPVFAARAEGVNALRWDNIFQVSHTITITGTSGEGKATVHGIPGVSYIEGNICVYKLKSSGAWTLIGYDEDSTSSRVLTLCAPFTAVAGGRYKSVLTATVYYMGVGETVTDTVYKNN